MVSTDFGAEVMHDALVDHESGDSVMRVLAAEAHIQTAYGGGFVNAVDGVKSTFGGTAEPSDWFYWVDGVLAQVGAADYRLRGGETVWWDFHPWQGSSFIPVVLQAFPAPWRDEAPIVVADAEADAVTSWAAAQGLKTTGRSSLATVPEGSAIVAATVAEIPPTSWLAEVLDQGPRAGVFVSIDGRALSALNHRGDHTAALSAAAIGAPHPADPAAHLLILLAADEAAMSDLLDTFPTLSRPYVGVGLSDGAVVGLPDESGED